MRRSHAAMLAALIVITTLVAATRRSHKDPTGVYGVIDRVVFEPEGAPERVQLWGVFALANGIEVANGEITGIYMGRYHPARRGYLYYAVNPADEAATLAEWSALAQRAGTGEAVAFGAFLPPSSVTVPAQRGTEAILELAERAQRYNGRVRRASEPPAEPDVFPQRLRNAPAGVLAAEGRPAAGEVVRVPAPVSPADGGTAAAGAARLIARNVVDATLRYVFELQGPDGSIERSEPMEPGDGETAWSPRSRLRAGETWTWRVWTVSQDSFAYPAAEATFRVDGTLRPPRG